MCVIVYKPKDVQIKIEDLCHMWSHNPDGAGFCYKTDIEGTKMCIIERGFMSLKPLKKRIKELQDRELVLHFRKKTHGKVEPIMTHPFPILPITAEEHKETEIICNSAFIHNGVMSRFGNQEVSDTFDFTANVLAHLNEPTQIKLIESMGGKFCLVCPSNIWLFGDFTLHEGLKCSNTFWKPYVAPPQAMDYGRNEWYSREDRAWKKKGYWNRDEVWDYKTQKYVPRQKSLVKENQPNLLPAPVTHTDEPKVDYKAASYTKEQEALINKTKEQLTNIHDANTEEQLKRLQEEEDWENYWLERGYGNFEM